jgi:3-methyladenine DNA glycosylase AlkD
VCARLAADPDDMVVKALSWALRELIKWDGAEVARWIDAHADVLHARVLREVRAKLTTGLKSGRARAARA